MLKVLKYKSRSQIVNLFCETAESQSWLVSDLRTKFELQKILLDKNGYFIDDSVLRASDLWKVLLKRADPEIRLVSDAFARSSLRTILEENELALGVSASAEATVFAYIDQMASLIFHPEGTQKLEEWLTQHEESSRKWKDWYLIARFCGMKLLKEQGIITQDWVAAYLQNFNQLGAIWNKPLVVDLSGEISRVEADIFFQLSRTVDITILQPDPTWKEEFHFLLQPYQDLESKAESVHALPKVENLQIGSSEVLRFSGLLAEIKNAVGQVRVWLDQKIDPTSIAILAPDIEVPWTVLQTLLEEEGIPFQKDRTHKLQSLPSVNRWLANLRSRSGRLSASDLEIVFYGTEESKKLRYENFRSLFKSLFDDEDTKRNDIVDRVLLQRESESHFLVRNEFIARALIYWGEGDSEPVQSILRELLQNASSRTQWSWKEWLKYLESIAATKEYCLYRGDPAGITVTRVMSAHSDKLQHRVFIGLTDEALRVKNRTLLSGRDYFDLAHDLGFYLDNPEQSNLDFELRLLAENHSIQDIYSFGATDLEGTLCSPAQFWMTQKGDHEILKIPQVTRWDQIQGMLHRDIRKFTVGRDADLLASVHRDLGYIKTSPIHAQTLPRISASSIERFLDCPFIFAAERHFRLKDLPDIDLDVDHRTRGQLAHALFEKLTIEPMRFNWGPEEIGQLLEDIKIEKQLVFADARLWIPLRSRHIQLAQRFLANEKEWRSEFPKAEIVGREQRFNFYLDPRTQEIHREPKENCFQVSGQIDRIDGDSEGNLSVIDYKSSSGGLFAATSWIKNNQLQLLFYMWVLEKSLVDDLQGDVIAAFYYIFKDFSRKGFKIEELAGTLYAAGKRKDSAATRENKELYLKQFSEILMNCLDQIFHGRIEPQPSDTKICKDCEWRRQCRAPHLM